MSQLVYCLGRDFVGRAGGGESYVNSQAMSAFKLGLKPEVYSLDRHAADHDLGYVRVTCAGGFGFEFRPEFVDLYKRRLAAAVVERLETEPGPNVIHSFGPWAAAGQRATEILRRRGVEVSHVVTMWELFGPHTRSKRGNELIMTHAGRRLRQAAIEGWVNLSTVPAERAALRLADAVIVNYRRLDELLKREYRVETPISVLPYATMTAWDPVDSTEPLPKAIDGLDVQGGPIVLATSRHEPRKGVDVLIRALALLRDAGVPFRTAIVGKGSLLEAHRRLVGELSLEDRVVLPGAVPDVRPFLAHADVHCLPSLAEGSGSMSVNEALQFAVPVVASGVDGLLEDLTDGVDALLVRPGSVAEIAEAVRRLIENPSLRVAIGSAGRALFERKFSPEAQTAALDDLYSRLGLPGVPSLISLEESWAS